VNIIIMVLLSELSMMITLVDTLEFLLTSKRLILIQTLRVMRTWNMLLRLFEGMVWR